MQFDQSHGMLCNRNHSKITLNVAVVSSLKQRTRIFIHTFKKCNLYYLTTLSPDVKVKPLCRDRGWPFSFNRRSVSALSADLHFFFASLGLEPRFTPRHLNDSGVNKGQSRTCKRGLLSVPGSSRLTSSVISALCCLICPAFFSARAGSRC